MLLTVKVCHMLNIYVIKKKRKKVISKLKNGGMMKKQNQNKNKVKRKSKPNK